ncbi:hypothetical protein G3I56_40385 [Streptomyces sp. SID12488]|nr:hypothetical protein [Streptomyces sp. SID12488]
MFPVGEAEATRERTTWEYEHLRIADVILFWFCTEVIQPISLYEFGAHAARVTRLAVGAHPEYPPPGRCRATAARPPGRDRPWLAPRHRSGCCGVAADHPHHPRLIPGAGCGLRSSSCWTVPLLVR